MSQFPDPGNPQNPAMPLPYAQPGFRPPKLRPTSVTVLAIIGIIWGSLVLLGSLCNTVQSIFGLSINGNNPLVKAMQDDRVMFAWSIVGVIVNFILGVLLLGGSIWSLSLKPRGRSWLIAYSWFDIGFTLVALVVSAAVINPRMNQIVAQSTALDAMTKNIMQTSMWVGLIFSAVLLVYPALILYFLSRPHVKEAFQRGMVAPNPQWGVGNAPHDPRPGGYPPPPGGAGTY